MSTSEEALVDPSKQSEATVDEVTEPTSASVIKPSEPAPAAEDHPEPEATESASKAKKRKKTAPVQLDEEGNPIKKVRAPYVYTDKRKEAFERCRLKRAETIAKRKEEETAKDGVKKEVRSQIRTLRNLMETTDPQLISSSLQQTLHSVQTTLPMSAPDLTVSSMRPSEPPPPQPPQMEVEPAPTPQQELTTTAPQQQLPQAVQALPPKAPLTFEQMAQEDEEWQTAPDDPNDPRLQVREMPIVSGKRKLPPPRKGTGAGNHEPYEGEPGYVEVQYRPREEAVDIDRMSDEELALFMARARDNAERRGLFNVRRQNGKMQRPSHASMFLDHSYVHAQSVHPSNLHAPRNAGAGFMPPPSQGGAGGGAAAGSGDFLWL